MPGGDPALEWKGVAFYPTTDPTEYARRKARVFSPLPDTLFYVPSVGMGYGLRELLAQLPPRSAVLCVEVFPEVMGQAIGRGLPTDARLLVVRTSEAAGVAAALQRLGVRGFRRVVRQPLCAGYRLAPGLYELFHRVLQQGIRRYWQNRLTLIAMGSLQVRNLLTNLGSLGGAWNFSSLSTGMPVVVAGAGPSLERSLEIMLRLRDRFVLAAVDTALPTLRAGGLCPDIVVALEAQAANLQDFIGHLDDGQIRLACDLSAHPALLRIFPRRLFLFSSVFAPLRLFERLEAAGLRPCAFPPLGSVGVAAVHAALRLTSAEVFLTGLDFSYPGARTHARGNPWHLAMLAGATRQRPVGQDSYRALASRPLIAATGKRGEPLRTDAILKSYRDTLEDELSESTGRVADIGSEGLPLGVSPIDEREMEDRIRRAHAGPRLHAAAALRFPVDRVRRFISAEKTLLLGAAEAAGRAAGIVGDGVADAPGDRAEALRDIDYAWVHFPDAPDLDTPDMPARDAWPVRDAGFLARVRVAAGYYAGRLERLLSVI